MKFSRSLLAKAMADRGVNPAKLAARAGVSESAIYHWLAGTRTPNLRSVIKLAEALGLASPAALLQ